MSGRQEWLLWRKAGVGASDSPSIMGASPYKNIEQLFAEKVATEVVEMPMNPAMRKGNELEPIARKHFAAWWNLEHGLFDADAETFDAARVEHPDAPFMRASLDGASKDMKVIIEIKYQGQENHKQMVLTKDLRSDYWTQMQHQYICNPAAEEGYLVSITEKGKKDSKDYDVQWIPIPPDRAYHRIHFEKCFLFWESVLAYVPPASVQNAVQTEEFEKLEGMDDVIERWKVLKLMMEEKESELEDCRAQILAKVTKPKMFACGVTITQVEKAGSVDYKKVKELKGVDLEPYRKPSTLYSKMEIK